jgi:hypothetical protein
VISYWTFGEILNYDFFMVLAEAPIEGKYLTLPGFEDIQPPTSTPSLIKTEQISRVPDNQLPLGIESFNPRSRMTHADFPKDTTDLHAFLIVNRTHPDFWDGTLKFTSREP